MPNPYLPLWEYIPDGEPRVFGSRVYVYGSHDRVGHDQFCDYVLKCWSAPVDDLNHWTDHGVIFRTRDTFDHPADTDWTKEHNELYAPDVVEKDGKYYLFAYIIGAKGCVAVSDRPEGPFTLLGRYKYTIPDSVCVNGWFIDPGVLVDDDGQVYIACGFERSFIAKIEPQDIGKLDMVNWKLGVNSFLAHGYYKYQYLMLGKVKMNKAELHVIGVPGIFTNKERYLAHMFGFRVFIPVRKTKILTGNFGYWVSEIVESEKLRVPHQVNVVS